MLLIYTKIVHTIPLMKNITFRADADLIDRARQIARDRQTSLNAIFRQWLEEYVCHSRPALEFDALMKRLRHVRAGGPYTREEMNTR